MPHLQAINLSKSYSNKRALMGWSFSATGGEVIGILGANGAGKSTLIKLLAGVIKPDKGDAILNGHSIRNERSEAQGKIGYLPEVTGGFDDITVYEFLSFSANAHGIFGKAMRGAVSRICEDLNLSEVKKKNFQTYQKAGAKELGLANL